MLSTLQIKSAKPRAKPYKLADSGGLYLLVQPSGSKLWRYKFRIGRVEGLQALGSFPEVSLADVRAEHAKSRKLVEQGIHPVQERKQRRKTLAIEYLNREKGEFGTICAQWDDATSVDGRKQQDRHLPCNSTASGARRPVGPQASAIEAHWGRDAQHA